MDFACNGLDRVILLKAPILKKINYYSVYIFLTAALRIDDKLSLITN